MTEIIVYYNIIYNTKYNISIIPNKLNNEWQVLKITQ